MRKKTIFGLATAAVLAGLAVTSTNTSPVHAAAGDPAPDSGNTQKAPDLSALKAANDQAKADEAAAQTAYTEAQNNANSAQLALTKAQSNLVTAQDNLKAAQAATPEAIQQAREAVDQAKKAVTTAQSADDNAAGDLATAQKNLADKQATLKTATDALTAQQAKVTAAENTEKQAAADATGDSSAVQNAQTAVDSDNAKVDSAKSAQDAAQKDLAKAKDNAGKDIKLPDATFKGRPQTPGNMFEQDTNAVKAVLELRREGNYEDDGGNADINNPNYQGYTSTNAEDSVTFTRNDDRSTFFSAAQLKRIAEIFVGTLNDARTELGETPIFTISNLSQARAMNWASHTASGSDVNPGDGNLINVQQQQANATTYHGDYIDGETVVMSMMKNFGSYLDYASAQGLALGWASGSFGAHPKTPIYDILLDTPAGTTSVEIGVAIAKNQGMLWYYQTYAGNEPTEFTVNGGAPQKVVTETPSVNKIVAEEQAAYDQEVAAASPEAAQAKLQQATDALTAAQAQLTKDTQALEAATKSATASDATKQQALADAKQAVINAQNELATVAKAKDAAAADVQSATSTTAAAQGDKDKTAQALADAQSALSAAEKKLSALTAAAANVTKASESVANAQKAVDDLSKTQATTASAAAKDKAALQAAIAKQAAAQKAFDQEYAAEHPSAPIIFNGEESTISTTATVNSPKPGNTDDSKTKQAATYFRGVATIAKGGAVVYDGNFQATSRVLSAGTNWKSFAVVIGKDGREYYDLGGNQYVLVSAVSLAVKTKTPAAATSKAQTKLHAIAHINYVPGYGIQVWHGDFKTMARNADGSLKKLGDQTNWKVFGVVTDKGHVFYNLGGDQFIDAAYVTLR
ncbi:SLAP domain-containing protein [Lacticaseibacillus zhaodongensis]|uniref:SLAP domain-containing protein n=1 Tax=Lacticaseibacillus zhaodongensis TaxID=2668065 RepID=UPI0012D2D334|nr:SLAP domain-containing protein [Lacticaseibacillus zhaodongensis]